MDEVHSEFESLLHKALTSDGSALLEALKPLVEHLKMHFDMEDQWMTETGFPARDCHVDEHAAVLRSAEEVMALATQGNNQVVRAFAEELARWFPGHADYLDSALATWMCKRQFGGKPVVLHRRPVTS